jgi:hypothetical protein
MNITYSIISRGTMSVKCGDKEVLIYGELTFEPPVFYANLNSIKTWQPPFESISITENEKKELIEFLSNSQRNDKTKIVFD